MIKLLLQLIYHTIYRNTFCRFGFHKWKPKTAVLALGEKLIVPTCSIYGCGCINSKRAILQVPNDGNNGTVIDIMQDKPKIVGRAFVDPKDYRSISVKHDIMKRIKP